MEKRRRINCYVEDTALITDNEDDLQRQLFRFPKDCNKFDLTISPVKTKIIPLRCKLELQGEKMTTMNTTD